MTYIAHPINEAQDKAVKAFFDALEIPYEKEPEIDETEYLLSTEANKERLMAALKSEQNGEGISISLDDNEIWK